MRLYPPLLAVLEQHRKAEKDAKRNTKEWLKHKRQEEKDAKAAARRTVDEERLRLERARQAQLEAERRQREEEAQRQKEAEAQQPHLAPARQKRNRKPEAISGGTIVLCLLIYFGYSNTHHRPLRSALKLSESASAFDVDAYFADTFSNENAVLDLKDVKSGASARRIDCIHLLMQFGHHLHPSVRRLILAHNGQQVFYLLRSDIDELAGQYAAGARIWAFNHLPERLKTMSGQNAYDTWTGGVLGVLSEQIEDLNDAMSKWLEG